MVDIRLLQNLPPDFLQNRPELQLALNSDTNRDGQLDQSEAERGLLTSQLLTQFHEIRAQLQNQNLSEAQIAQIRRALESYAQILQDPRSIERLRQQNSSPQLRTSAQAFLLRLESQLQPRNLNLSSLLAMPRNFRNHILPNYFPALARAQTADANHDGEVSLEEISTQLRREDDERLEISRRDNPRSEEAILSLENLNRAAQITLIMAQEELGDVTNILSRNERAARIADYIPGRLQQFNLEHLDLIPQASRERNETFRILLWMRSRHLSSPLLSHTRADELFEERVLDLQPLRLALLSAQQVAQGSGESLAADALNCLNWLNTLASQAFIITEEEFAAHLRQNPLNLSSIFSPLRSLLHPGTKLGFLANLFQSIASQHHGAQEAQSAEDSLLTDEDWRRTFAEMRRLAEAQHAPSEQIHIFPRLWELFEATKEINPDFRVLRTEETTRKVSGEAFFARALTQLVYLRPEMAVDMAREAKLSAVLDLLQNILAEGLHAQDRAHASNQSVGYLQAFSLFHARGWVRQHAEGTYQTRLAALQHLRDVVQRNHARSLSEALPGLQRENREHFRILTEELHAPELERIFNIQNTRINEESFLDFCEHVLRYRPRPESGILERFRLYSWPDNIHHLSDLFLSNWQQRNTPAATSFYDSLARYSTNQMIVSQSALGMHDARGNGGSLFPLFLFRDWGDDEGSLDGIFDTVMGSTLSLGIVMGLQGGLNSMRLAGNGFSNWWTSNPANDIPWLGRLFEWMGRAETSSALGWNGLARSSFSVSRRSLIEASGWLARNSIRIPYRGLRWLSNVPFQRLLSSAEVEVLNQEVVSSLETHGWSLPARAYDFPRFQSAILQSGRLLHNPNAPEAMARAIRLSQILASDAESTFQSVSEIAHETAQIVPHSAESLEHIEQNILRLSNAAKRAQAFHRAVFLIRSPLGIPLGESNSLGSLEESLQGLQSLRTELQQSLGRSTLPPGIERPSLRRLTNIVSRAIDRIEQIKITAGHQAALGASATLLGILSLSRNAPVANVAGRMMNPHFIYALQSHFGQNNAVLLLVGWQMLHNATSSYEDRSPTNESEFASSVIVRGAAVDENALHETYLRMMHMHGSRASFANAYPSLYADEVAEEPRREALPFDDLLRSNLGEENLAPQNSSSP